MLNAKNLMIGDWVEIDGKIGTVSFLDKEGYINVAINETQMFTRNPNPIQLTPEILEKNKMREFEHRNPGQGDNLIKKWWHKDGSYYVSLYSVGDEYTYTVGDSITRICRIRYVHELQHALQLCGIEKEIII